MSCQQELGTQPQRGQLRIVNIQLCFPQSAPPQSNASASPPLRWNRPTEVGSFTGLSDRLSCYNQSKLTFFVKAQLRRSRAQGGRVLLGRHDAFADQLVNVDGETTRRNSHDGKLISPIYRRTSLLALLL
ncbi:MAG: hypothetical protein H6822_00585 [Planctomycetaceae bacterium]|nr:hypothetical protein [Planctomycetales bacterium]MCB9920641.1 hypothetical protein [Planctomycetaceae bacterium]